MANKTNEFLSVKKYLKKEKIKVDFSEFKEQLKSHPNFPSLLSFYDALCFFKITSVVLRLEAKDLDSLPNDFLALVGSEGESKSLIYVQKKEKGYNLMLGNDAKFSFLNKGEFIKIWDNIVLLVDNSGNIETKLDFSNSIFFNKILLFLSLLLFVLIFTLEFKSIYDLFLLVLSSVGVYLSVEASKQELDVQSEFSEKFCKVGATNESSGCEKIIKSSDVTLFKFITLGDLSLIFFSGQLISFFLLFILERVDSFYNYNFIFLLFVIPVIMFSVYYQLKIKKDWCLICLAISIVIVMELILSFFIVDFIFFIDVKLVLLYVFGFLFISLVWLSVKNVLKKYLRLKESKISDLRLRKNYSLFRYKLAESKKFDYNNLKSFIQIGNQNSKLKLTIITHPFCKHCASIHNLLNDLAFRNDVLLNIRFNIDSKKPNEYNDGHFLYNQLCLIYYNDGPEKFMEALGYWFLVKNLKYWFSKYGKEPIDENIMDKLLNQSYLNSQNNIHFTPTLIVGENLFPNIYDKKDLLYFIDDLKVDSSFIIK